MLSVSLVPSVSVESAMESNDVLMTCFCPMLRDTERSLRSQRFVVASGTPSAAAIFLAPKPRVAMRSMAKRSSVDRTML